MLCASSMTNQLVFVIIRRLIRTMGDSQLIFYAVAHWMHTRTTHSAFTSSGLAIFFEARSYGLMN